MSAPAERREKTGGETAGKEHHGAPFAYYVHWALLLVVAALGRQQYRRLRRVGPVSAAEAGSLPAILVGLVSVTYFVETLSSVQEYHEPSGVGLLRFLVKLGCGVWLLVYGLGFLHEHEGHDTEKTH